MKLVDLFRVLIPASYSSARAVVGLAVLAAALSALGCGGSDEATVPVGDAAENIRRIVVAYVQYAAQHGGKGPPDQATLAKFMAQQLLITEDEANAKFTSPRDSQPYVIKWGIAPLKPPTGEGAPQPEILIYEAEGADGTRYVADGRSSITEYTAEQFAQVVPDAAG